MLKDTVYEDYFYQRLLLSLRWLIPSAVLVYSAVIVYYVSTYPQDTVRSTVGALVGLASCVWAAYVDWHPQVNRLVNADVRQSWRRSPCDDLWSVERRCLLVLSHTYIILVGLALQLQNQEFGFGNGMFSPDTVVLLNGVIGILLACTGLTSCPQAWSAPHKPGVVVVLVYISTLILYLAALVVVLLFPAIPHVYRETEGVLSGAALLSTTAVLLPLLTVRLSYLAVCMAGNCCNNSRVSLGPDTGSSLALFLLPFIPGSCPSPQEEETPLTRAQLVPHGDRLSTWRCLLAPVRGVTKLATLVACVCLLLITEMVVWFERQNGTGTSTTAALISIGCLLLFCCVSLQASFHRFSLHAPITNVSTTPRGSLDRSGSDSNLSDPARGRLPWPLSIRGRSVLFGLVFLAWAIYFFALIVLFPAADKASKVELAGLSLAGSLVCAHTYLCYVGRPFVSARKNRLQQLVPADDASRLSVFIASRQLLGAARFVGTGTIRTSLAVIVVPLVLFFITWSFLVVVLVRRYPLLWRQSLLQPRSKWFRALVAVHAFGCAGSMLVLVMLLCVEATQFFANELSGYFLWGASNIVVFAIVGLYEVSLLLDVWQHNASGSFLGKWSTSEVCQPSAGYAHDVFALAFLLTVWFGPFGVVNLTVADTINAAVLWVPGVVSLISVLTVFRVHYTQGDTMDNTVDASQF